MGIYLARLLRGRLLVEAGGEELAVARGYSLGLVVISLEGGELVLLRGATEGHACAEFLIHA